MNFRKLKLLFISVTALIFLGGFFVFSKNTLAAVGILKQINFQGKVVNSDGTNVANSSYNFLFCIYATASPASPCTAGANNDAIWRESKSITVTDGVFQTNLGDTTTLPGAVDFNTDNIFLGINFNSNGQMSPLVQFTATPYAFNADNLDGLNSATYGTDAHILATDSSGNLSISGRIGIGTTTPSAWLSITGATSSGASLNLAIGTAPTGGSLHEGDLWYDGTNLYFRNSTISKNLLAAGGSSQWTTIGSDIFYDLGYVGIGTTAPSSPLSVISHSETIPTTVISQSGDHGAVALKLNLDDLDGNDSLPADISFLSLTCNGVECGGISRGSGIDYYANQRMRFMTTANNADIMFYPNGTGRFIVANGNVGIGVTDPLASLDIAAATAGTASLRIEASASIDPTAPNTGDLWFNGANLFFRKDGSTNVDLLTSIGSQWTNSGTDIYFGSSVYGSVGIGTVTPTAVLEINGGSREETGLKISNLDLANIAIDLSSAGLSGSSDYFIYEDANTYWRADGTFSAPGSIYGTNFYDFNNPAYYFSPDNTGISLTMAGNTGIGTTSPDNSLSINRASSGGNPVIDYMIGGTTIFSQGVDQLDGNKFKIQLGSNLSGVIPPFVIDSSGNIGIGTSNPDALLTLNEISSNPIIDFEFGAVDKFAVGIDHADSDKFKIEAGASGTLGSIAPAFAINGSSNVGIGTANPLTRLNLAGGHFTLGPLNTTTAAQIYFQEGSNYGTTYVGIKAPDSFASSFTLTLPTTLGTSGQVLQTDNAGNLSWTANAATGMSNPTTTVGDLIYASVAGTPATVIRLGIGTTGQCLTVSGGVPVWGSCSGTAAGGATTQVIFNNAGTYTGSANFTWDNTNYTLSSVGTFAGAKVSLALRNSDAGATSSNELQIGNNSLANALSLMVNSSAFTGAANYAYIYNKNNAPLILGTNNIGRVAIDAANGNVGIGITVPTAKLHIVDNVVTTLNTILATTTSLTSGNFAQLTNNGTVAANNQTVLNVLNTGANGTASITSYGSQVINSHTGATLVDIGGYFLASGGVGNASTNYSLRVGAMNGDSSYGLDIGAMTGNTTNVGIQIGAISTGATTDTGISIGAISGGGTGTAIATGTVSTTAANAYQLNLGNGGNSINANNTTHYGINIGAIGGTATNAYGINLGTIAAGSTGTYGVAVGAMTGANAGSSNYGLYVANIGTTTATTNAGLAVANQSGIATNVYGVNVGTMSGAAGTNTGLYINTISASTAAKYEINTAGITGSAAGTATAINLGAISGSTNGATANNQIVTGAVSGVATNNYQLNLSTVTGGTTGNYGINVGAVTGVAGDTNIIGINLAGVVNPNAATAYGIKVAANTTVSGTGTASYGMQITGPTGAATANYGLNVVMPTTGTHNSGIVIGTVVTNAGTWALYSAAANNSYFAGNIGIGVTVPVAMLDIKAAAAATLQLEPWGASATQTGEFRMMELTANGTDYAGFKAPDAIATNANVILTLPSTFGTNGQILQTSNTGVLSWANNAATGMSNVLTTTGDMVYSSGGTTAARLGVGTNGQCLTSNGTTPLWGSCNGGAAGGSNTQVIFNSGGSYTGSANFIWDNTNFTLSSLGSITGAKISMALRNTDAGTATTNELRIGNDALANTLSFLVNSSTFTNNLNNAYILNKSTTNAGALILGTNNAERMRIAAAGNIGIGAAGSFTTAAPPLSLLDITNNTIVASQNDSYGLTLNNNTAATNNNQKWSPAIRFRGYGWAGASQPFDIRAYVRPVQTTPLTGALDFQSQSNNGGYVDLMSLLGGANGGILSLGSNAPAATISRLNILDNIVTTGNSILATTTSLTSGNFMQLTENGPAAAANQTMLNIITTGANTTGAITTYGMQVANTHTGTTPTNTAAAFTATGGTTNYGVRVIAMTGATNYGMDIGTLSGATTNVALNIGNISAGATTDSAITIGTIAGGGIGSAITTGAVSTTGNTATQLNLGAISGNNITSHYGISVGNISGVAGTAYGLSLGTLNGGTGTMAQINAGAISGGATNVYGINLGTITGGITANYGLAVGVITTTGASNSYGVNIAAMTGTGGNAAALNIPAMTTVGSTNYGINLGGLTGAGNNNYGLYIGTITNAQTGKYSIMTNGLTGNATGSNISLSIGAIASSTSGTVTNSQMTTGAVGGVALNNYQLSLSTVTGGTTGNYGISIGAVTGIAGATNAGIYVTGAAGPALSTVYGINVLANSATGTASYGMKLAGPTGAAVSNYGLNIVMPSAATHNSGLVIGAVPTVAGTWAIYSSAANNSYLAGSVGIGVVTPASLLDLKAATAPTLQIEPFGTSATQTGEFRMMELLANGTDYTGFKAPDAIGTGANLMYTLPSAYPTVTGYVLSATTAGAMSWVVNNASSAMANPMTTIGDLIYANTTATPANPTRLPIGSAGQCLIVSGGNPAWGSCSNTSAAGSATQVQFNTGSAFGASANFIWDNSTYTLSSLGSITGGKISLALRNTGAGTGDTNELRIGNDASANALSLLVNSSAFTNAVNYAYILNKNATGALVLGVNNTERMRIDATAGNIGIGAAGSFTTAAPPLSLLDITRNAIATTQGDAYGLTLNNNTAAANNAQQFSPPIRFRGYGWNTSVSQSADMRMFARPIQAAAVTVALDFQSSIAGGSYVDLMSLITGTNGGTLGIGITAPTSSRLHIVDNVVTTGNSILATTTSLTSGNLVSFSSTGTVGVANQTVLNVANSGASATGITYGLQASNSHTGSGTTNIAGLFTASGGVTANTGLQVATINTNATNIGLNIVGMTSTGAATNTGVVVGAISGNTSGTNTGMSIGNISGAVTNAYGINLGTLTGATTANYQINTGVITAVANATHYGINLGGITGAAALSTSYGIKVGVISSTGTNNYGFYQDTVSGSLTGIYGYYLNGITAGSATTAIGVRVGAISGSTSTAVNTGIDIGTIGSTAATSNTGINMGVITTTGATNSYGINIAALAGTGTSGYGIKVGGSTTALTNTYGINIVQPTGATHNAALEIGTADTGAGTWSIYSTSASSSYFAGNIGIGTTNPLRSLHTTGSIRMGALITGAGGAVAVYRDTNGDLADSTSSIQYKTDVSTMENVLPKVMALRPVRFKWNDQSSTPGMDDYGMIAEEVNTTLPDLVTYNEDGSVRGLKYEKMGVFALKGLQELAAEVNTQQSQVASVTNNQNEIVKQLTGQLADQNLSVDSKLQLIGSSLTDLTTKQIKTLNDQIIDQTKDIANLQSQMADIQTQNKAFNEFLLAFDVKNIDNFAKKNAPLNVFAGQLEAEGMVAGAFSVKVVDETKKTLGSATVCEEGKVLKDDTCAEPSESELPSDGETVEIKTTVVTVASKIFITPIGKTPVSWIISEVNPGAGFRITLSEKVAQAVKFNWWIVEAVK